MERAPFWSPDGAQIAFVAAFGARLKTLDAVTGLVLQDLTAIDDWAVPVWSPDSVHLAYAEAGSIYRIRAYGTQPSPTRVTGGGDPDWNPAWVEDLP